MILASRFAVIFLPVLAAGFITKETLKLP